MAEVSEDDALDPEVGGVVREDEGDSFLVFIAWTGCEG